jgi:hypothetical protein
MAVGARFFGHHHGARKTARSKKFGGEKFDLTQMVHLA